jgi:hypothetical protein
LETFAGRSFLFYFTDEAEASWPERDFEEGEVLEVVKAMNSDKAPSLDGFSMAFFQACWIVFKRGHHDSRL